MRRLMVLLAVRAVLVTCALLAVPMLLILARLATRSREQLATLPEKLAQPEILGWATLVVIALGTASFTIALRLARREASRVSGLLDDLGERAERLGIGDSRPGPMHTGIVEIDRLSQAVSRGAQASARRLASERDFAADASHQLRTPLTALLMRLEEIAATDDLAVAEEEAHIAIAQVERLSRTVDDLMGRTRSEVETKPTVSLDSVLAALQRELQPAFAAARRSIHVRGERGLRVRATPVALAQILATMLENSLAHGGGTVSVMVRRAGPSIVIELTDQGEGVPAAIAPHVFERSVSSTGSGLGLTLARDLAEAAGGRLELVSARPAVFALFLSESTD